MELYHAYHKYTDRYMGKNGKWVYEYPEDKKQSNVNYDVRKLGQPKKKRDTTLTGYTRKDYMENPKARGELGKIATEKKLYNEGKLNPSTTSNIRRAKRETDQSNKYTDWHYTSNEYHDGKRMLSDIKVRKGSGNPNALKKPSDIKPGQEMRTLGKKAKKRNTNLIGVTKDGLYDYRDDLGQFATVKKLYNEGKLSPEDAKAFRSLKREADTLGNNLSRELDGRYHIGYYDDSNDMHDVQRLLKDMKRDKSYNEVNVRKMGKKPTITADDKKKANRDAYRREQQRQLEKQRYEEARDTYGVSSRDSNIGFVNSKKGIIEQPKTVFSNKGTRAEGTTNHKMTPAQRKQENLKAMKYRSQATKVDDPKKWAEEQKKKKRYENGRYH